jgi:hypothetical protein
MADQDTFEKIQILGVIEDEVGTPKNDGTRGSALYAVPIRLSKRVDSTWAAMFERCWDRPPSFSTMHRSGICSVYGDKIILNSTTIEEVKNYHAKTLSLVLEAVNQSYLELVSKKQNIENHKEEKEKDHRTHVRHTASQIKFDGN